MQKKLALKALLLFSLFAFSSCEDDLDIINPTIQISSPSNGDIFTITDQFEIIGRATDDISLKSFSITSILGIDENYVEFDNSTDFPFNITLTLDPATPAGDYDIVLKAVDTSDNEAETSVNITVQ